MNEPKAAIDRDPRLVREHRARLEHYLTPIGPKRSANVDPGRKEQLQKLGYGG